MMCDFRRIFNPTVEEQIQDIDFFLNLHNELIGYCCTCKHYKGSAMPGFVTDYGECLLKSPMFLRKVCTTTILDCPNYSENTDEVEELKNHREMLLKGEEK